MSALLRGSMVVLLSIAACTTADSGGIYVPNNAGAAVIATAIGVAAAVASRADGGCYANCVKGTACNPDTGLCEVLPCRGLCDETQDCDETGPVPKCVRKKADITIRREEDATPPESQPPE